MILTTPSVSSAPNRYLLLLLFMLYCGLSACTDKEDSGTGLVNDNYFEGPIRLETLPAKLMIPGNYLCYFVNRDTDQEIELKAEVEADGHHVTLVPTDPVPIGNYVFARATALDQQVIDQQDGRAEVALGCCFLLTKDQILEASNNYDDELGCFGSGTDEDPFLITSYLQLMSLSEQMSDFDPDFGMDVRYDLASYRLEADIDLANASHTYLNAGWIPIGNEMVTPFRGHFDGSGTDGKGYHVIKNLGAFSEGTQVTSPIGLFGYLMGAHIHNIEISNSSLRVQRSDPRVIPCGFIAGAVITTPTEQITTTLRNCRVDKDCRIKGEILSGGLVGVVDQYANLLIDSCENRAAIENRHHHAGGLVGGAILGSTVYLRNSLNTGAISNQGNSTGGLIGSADSLAIERCKNVGKVETVNGAVGAGGLAGSVFNGSIIASRNQGTVRGDLDAGGLVGTTAYERAEDTGGQNTYGNLMVNCSANYADVTGSDRVGGIAGGAQLNAYDSFNFGSIAATCDMAAGFVGFTPISAIFNCNNDGPIRCDSDDTDSSAGGIVGYGNDFLILGCDNFGAIDMNAGNAGGIYGYGEQMGFVSYSGNIAPISCRKGSVGGIAGRAGKRKNFDTQNAVNILNAVASGIGSFIEIKYGKHKVAKKAMDGLGTAGSVLSGLASIHDFAGGCKIHASQLTPAHFEAIHAEISEDLAAQHELMTRAPATHIVPFATAAMLDDQLAARREMYEGAFKDNSRLIENANTWRDDINDDLTTKERSHEIGMNALKGFIMCFSLASIFAEPMGPIASKTIAVVSSVLSIIQESVDYSFNRVALSQVYNYGLVSLAGTGYCAGVAGELNDYARMADSYSVGNLRSTSKADQTALLTARTGHRPRLGRNYAAADTYHSLFGSTAMVEYDHNFGYTKKPVSHQPSGANMLLEEEMKRQDSYKGFDFGYRWQLAPNGNLPIARKSMLENYTKEYY